MSYEIIWGEDIVTVEFTGEITVKEISLANKFYYGDPKLYKTSASIFDFSKSSLKQDVADNDLTYLAAIDLGAAFTLKQYKLALVVATENGAGLANEYIKICKNAGSPWQFEVFYNVDEANNWINS